jgi:divalent metal cation (Fe/Co/Zn/Cd) transporter
MWHALAFKPADGEHTMYSKSQILGSIIFALVIIIVGLVIERSGTSYPVAAFDVVYVPIGLGVLVIGYLAKLFYQKGRW